MGILVGWRWAGAALALLLAFDMADAALYVAHILSLHGKAPEWLRNPLFNMNREFGLGESVEYLKSLGCAGALAVCARRAGEPVLR